MMHYAWSNSLNSSLGTRIFLQKACEAVKYAADTENVHSLFYATSAANNIKAASKSTDCTVSAQTLNPNSKKCIVKYSVSELVVDSMVVLPPHLQNYETLRAKIISI